MNIIVCGCSGSGKTTAIKRILTGAEEPIYGFWTEKLAEDPQTGSAPVYIHGCGEQLSFAPDHQIGSCKNCCAEKHPEVFDDVGVALLRGIPEGSLVLLDEIGVMEEAAKKFTARLFELLDDIRAHAKSVNVSAKEANTPEFVAHARKILRL